MKKIIALILTLIVVMMSFAACAEKNPDPAETTPATTPAPTPEKPVLKMATNAYFQPYEFYKDGKIVDPVELTKIINNR